MKHSTKWLGIGALLGGLLGGCAVQEPDLARWETTLGGPKRLSAVVLFDKYPLNLRVDAALSLVRMKPRKGRHVGIDRLVKGTLVCDPEYIRADEPCQKQALTPDMRAKILEEMMPTLIEELRRDPPKPTQGGQATPDPSFKFKDAAYLMLTYDKTQVIADQALRKKLEAALIDWAMTDFERRLNDRTQAFGMEQLLRHIGPASVKRLPPQMKKNVRSLSQMADLIAKIGSKETKEEASKRLVAIADYGASEKWKEEHLGELKAANEKAGYDPTPKDLFKQLITYQSESLTRVFASMKKVGGSAVVDFCLKFADTYSVPPDLDALLKQLDAKAEKEKDAKKKKKLKAERDDLKAWWDETITKRRQTALAALEGHIDRKNKSHVAWLFKIVSNPKTPGEVTDQAFRRIREMPREAVLGDLYKMFEGENWKVRRLAGSTVLRMSEVKHIEEFLTKLNAKATKNFNLAEANTYGAYLGELKGGDPLKTLEPFMTEGEVRARVTALAYWYSYGDKTMVAKIAPYANDKTKIPECDEEKGDCEWSCYEKKDDKEAKEVKTVGDYVKFCVYPQLTAREPKKEEKGSKKEGKKDDKKDG